MKEAMWGIIIGLAIFLPMWGIVELAVALSP